MTIQVPPEIRESQISIMMETLDSYYARKIINYSQLEESMRRMSDEDLQAAVVYSKTPDFRAIASRVLTERGSDIQEIAVARLPVRETQHITQPIPEPIKEVLF